MDDHLRILQQRVQAKAVWGERAGFQRERRRGKIEQQQEEDLHAGQDGRGVGGETDVNLVAHAQDEPVRRQQPGPK